MAPYGSLGGDSGIEAHEIGENCIRVQFSDGSVYLYTYESAGSQNIEEIKQLAINGEGLNSFINTTVRYDYAEKES